MFGRTPGPVPHAGGGEGTLAPKVPPVSPNRRLVRVSPPPPSRRFERGRFSRGRRGARPRPARRDLGLGRLPLLRRRARSRRIGAFPADPRRRGETPPRGNRDSLPRPGARARAPGERLRTTPPPPDRARLEYPAPDSSGGAVAVVRSHGYSIGGRPRFRGGEFSSPARAAPFSCLRTYGCGSCRREGRCVSRLAATTIWSASVPSQNFGRGTLDSGPVLLSEANDRENERDHDRPDKEADRSEGGDSPDRADEHG